MTFKERLAMAEQASKNAYDEYRHWENLTNERKIGMEKAYQEQAYLNKIHDMAKQYSSLDDLSRYGEWKFDTHRPSRVHDFWCINTVTLYFSLGIEELTKMKRDRWLFSVSGCKKEKGTNGYTDYDYGNRMYNWQEGTHKQKFKTEEEARNAANDWMERIYNNHKVEIEKERSLMVEAWEQIQVYWGETKSI